MKTVSLLIISLISTFTYAQSFTYSPAQHIKDSAWADSYTSSDMDITNNTGKDITMEWKVLENTVGGKGWDNTLCTNLGCFSVMPQSGSFGLIKNDKIAYFKSHIKYNNEVRTGKLVFLIWDKNDLNTSDTVSFNYTALKTTGVNNWNNSNFTTKLFPSLVQTKFQISFSQKNISKNLAIYNLSGTKIWSDLSNNDLLDIDASSFISGVYILTIQYNNGSTETLKFIKQ